MTRPSSLTDPATLARLERLVALARRLSPQRSRKPTLKRLGRGVEPGGRRDYVPGDDLRFVDWPAYARLERLLIKVHEELPDPTLELVLDGSGSMSVGEPSPGLRTSLAAAALAACAVAREVRVGVWWAGDPLARLQLSRPGELVKLLRFLAARAPAGDAAHLERCVGRLCEQSRHCGAAVLLSDGLASEELARSAKQLSRRGFQTLVVLAAPEGELSRVVAAGANASGLAELVDAETGARRQVPFGPAALAEAARGRRARIQAVGRSLEDAAVPLEVLEPGAPFEAVALGLLRGP